MNCDWANKPTLLLIGLMVSFLTYAQAATTFSYRAEKDVALTADPRAPFWRNVKSFVLERDRFGQIVNGHRTEIRARWTGKNLYFLFICPYEVLHLKPNPVQRIETDFLWEWDVAEIFIGADFENINRYREFEVSPQGEWVDLNIDLSAVPKVIDEKWNSGFTSRCRLDRRRKVWFAEFCLPINMIDERVPRIGQEFRINFYRLQGPPPERLHLAWQPVNNPSYHTPEAFGRLRLEP